MADNKKEETICPYCGDNGAPVPKEDFERINNTFNGYNVHLG